MKIVAGALAAVVPPLLSMTAWAQPAESAEEPAPSGGFFSRFIDPSDGRLDVTAGSSGGTSGFVPLAVPGNEPSLGTGLLLALVYFHPTDVSETPSNAPPTMTGGGAAFTDKESWAVAGVHSAVWNGGRTEYLAVAGAASVNLDYYGTEALDLSENPVQFNIEGGILVQQAQFKIGDSRMFVGFRYTLLSTDVVFDVAPTAPLGLGKSNDAGLSVLLRLRFAGQHVYAKRR